MGNEAARADRLEILIAGQILFECGCDGLVCTLSPLAYTQTVVEIAPRCVGVRRN